MGFALCGAKGGSKRMAFGPGKYDRECTEIREKTKAHGVLLMVFGGVKGEGFSCQASPEITLSLPQILRCIANDIEETRHSV